MDTVSSRCASTAYKDMQTSQIIYHSSSATSTAYAIIVESPKDLSRKSPVYMTARFLEKVDAFYTP